MSGPWPCKGPGAPVSRYECCSFHPLITGTSVTYLPPDPLPVPQPYRAPDQAYYYLSWNVGTSFLFNMLWSSFIVSSFRVNSGQMPWSPSASLTRECWAQQTKRENIIEHHHFVQTHWKPQSEGVTASRLWRRPWDSGPSTRIVREVWDERGKQPLGRTVDSQRMGT